MNISLSYVIIYLPYVILEVRPCALAHTDSLFLAALRKTVLLFLLHVAIYYVVYCACITLAIQ